MSAARSITLVIPALSNSEGIIAAIRSHGIQPSSMSATIKYTAKAFRKSGGSSFTILTSW